MSFKLYTYMPNYRAWKILIAAAYNGIDIEIPPFEFGVDNKKPEFLRKNPFGKVPVLETPQGAIFESNAIARYVARLRNDTDLYGSSFFESSQVDQWVDAVANDLEPALLIAYYRTSETMQIDDTQFNEVLTDIRKFLSILDNYLLTRTYLVGNKITLADIVTATVLVEVYKKIFRDQIASEFINVNRWFLTCVNQPEFAKVIGPVQSEEKGDVKAHTKPQQQKQQQQQQQHEKGQKKEKQEKQEKPPKQEKPKPKAKEEEEEEEESYEDKPKEKNPLDSLPKSSMSLDAVKKLFFEKRPRFDLFFVEFWKIFDPQGFSIYTISYNYNEDNKVCYMTSNLTAGYTQRLEDLRKYAFGVLNVTGKSEDHGPFKINGAFIFRGPGVPKEMKECPDTDYYTLSLVDINSEEQRKKVEVLFAADTVDNENVLDRKYFK